MHKIETVYTSTIINKIMPKFYDYIVSSELTETPYTSPLAVTTENCFFYFNGENVGKIETASRGGNILIERVDL